MQCVSIVCLRNFQGPQTTLTQLWFTWTTYQNSPKKKSREIVGHHSTMVYQVHQVYLNMTSQIATDATTLDSRWTLEVLHEFDRCSDLPGYILTAAAF